MQVSVPHLLTDVASRELLAVDEEVQRPEYLVSEVSLTALHLQLVKTVIRCIFQGRDIYQVMMCLRYLSRLRSVAGRGHRLTLDWFL